MRGFPQELLIVLIIGAVLLVQFLYTQLRRAALPMAETETEPEPQTAPLPFTTVRQRAEVDAHAARAIETPRAAPQTTAALVSPRTWPRQQRFSRTALLRDRRAVQDAIVIAAILRPCHAHRPHDGA